MSQPCHSPVNVLIHPNQFPEAVEASMCESLRTRQLNHKFHYDTAKQTLRWLRLHEALSPARTDPDCFRIYEAAFSHCVAQLSGATEVEVVSLGCGGGQKDKQLLQKIADSIPGVRLRYVPVDVSPGLALTARAAALEAGTAASDIVPIVVDLGSASDWALALSTAMSNGGKRILCFFGMLPNFLPNSVLPQLSRLVRPDDLLLLSANLAPGADYLQGVKQVLPLYDNGLTRDWLWSVMADLGVETLDGSMDFQVVGDSGRDGLLRIESNVLFARDCRIRYGGRVYDYRAGESFRLFFSYRHTVIKLAQLLDAQGLELTGSWENGSGEEGVFAVGRRRSAT